MRTRQDLLRARSASWTELERLVDKGDGPLGAARLSPTEVSTLAAEYRALASDLLQVRRDRLGADLERHLDTLAGRAHNVLHAGADAKALSVGALFLDFPGALRRNWRLFLLATFLFYGPFLAGGLSAYADESYALAMLDPSQMSSVESMYSDAPEREASGSNATMTGFYIWNNIGIAFRCFATGILAGLGSIWFLVTNGLFIGAVFGHLMRVGLGENLLTFVASHSPWELTAITISGAAGLQMGLSLVITHGRSRIGSLQSRAQELLRQVLGATLFLAIAAVLEAWLSPSPLPWPVKATASAAGWALVFGTILFAGRGRVPPDVLANRAFDGAFERNPEGES